MHAVWRGSLSHFLALATHQGVSIRPAEVPFDGPVIQTYPLVVLSIFWKGKRGLHPTLDALGCLGTGTHGKKGVVGGGKGLLGTCHCLLRTLQGSQDMHVCGVCWNTSSGWHRQ